MWWSIGARSSRPRLPVLISEATSFQAQTALLLALVWLPYSFCPARVVDTAARKHSYLFLATQCFWYFVVHWWIFWTIVGNTLSSDEEHFTTKIWYTWYTYSWTFPLTVTKYTMLTYGYTIVYCQVRSVYCQVWHFHLPKHQWNINITCSPTCIWLSLGKSLQIYSLVWFRLSTPNLKSSLTRESSSLGSIISLYRTSLWILPWTSLTCELEQSSRLSSRMSKRLRNWTFSFLTPICQV